MATEAKHEAAAPADSRIAARAAAEGPARAATTRSEAPRPTAEGPRPPPAPPVQQRAQFISLQVTLLAAIGVVFGILAIGSFAKAPSTTETTAPVATASTAPEASASAAAAPAATATRHRVGHGRAPAAAEGRAAGRLARHTDGRWRWKRAIDGLLAGRIGYTYWTFGGTVPGPMIRVPARATPSN